MDFWVCELVYLCVLFEAWGFC